MKELGALRRLREIAAEDIKPSDFTISEEKSGTLKVKVNATSGILISAMRLLAFCNSAADLDDDKDFETETGEYEKMQRVFRGLQGKLKTYSLSGKELNTGDYFKFKANGCYIKGEKEDIEKAIRAVCDYCNADRKVQEEWKAGADQRRKDASRLSSKNQRQRLSQLEQKYGKGIISRVKIRQIGGDDGYQWNLIIDGRSVLNGMTKREAEYEQTRAWERLAKK